MTVQMRIEDRPEVLTAGVRRVVPMEALSQFFSDAFSSTMRVMSEQGVAPAGPPYGKYYGSPSATVDVEAGFPVSSPIASEGEVRAGSLPGGRIASAEHVGPYDDLEKTYAALEQYIGEAGLLPADVMWESYVTDPTLEPDPSRWHTLVSWLIAGERALAP